MIRPFQKSDILALLMLLDLNIPRYFDPSEAADYEDYLNREVEDYFVMEEAGEIIGAGGINYFYKKAEARISWDVVHPAHQGKGIGKALTIYRINHIKDRSDITAICVRTSQMAHKFYEKAGFKLEKIENDYWAKGFHLYLMRMKL